MRPQRFALIGGIVMLAMGVLALIPAFSIYTTYLPPLYFEASYGLFLGIFPMNILNKVVLIGFGVWGILASEAKGTGLPASISFSRWVFVVMGIAAILGLIPQTSTLGGNWPLFGAEVGVHAVFALLGAYFGFTLPRRAALENERLKKGNIRAA
jgi:hypothetical protein